MPNLPMPNLPTPNLPTPNLPKSVQSMTGYASLTQQLGTTTLSAELRSINSRFLDLTFKLPDELRVVEPALREHITATFARGKIECRIAIGRTGAGDRQAALDDGLLARLIELAGRVQSQAPSAAALSVADLMRWPGVLRDEVDDQSVASESIVALTHSGAEQLAASRAREGARLVLSLIERLDAIDLIVARLQPKVPQLIQAHAERLTERLRAALLSAIDGVAVPFDEMLARVRQEVTLYALRIDVAEELVRLAAHSTEMRRVLQGGGNVGKRLDFLMQEFNREANTLGSKGLDLDVSGAAVELKLLIEQMREQIQNLE